MLTNHFFQTLLLSANCRTARTSQALGLAALPHDFAAPLSSDRAHREVPS